MSQPLDCNPFLKWAGGKRWLVRKHCHLFPSAFSRYIEPFLGSGALFFALKPRRALLSDSNAELVNAYLAIRDDWEGVASRLARHQRLHSKPHYYSVRAQRPTHLTAQAARLIYLNRTCWNGLYRVNQQGVFNVPIGTRSSVLREEDNFAGVSKVLNRAEIRASDFGKSLQRARRGDFIYADPPYTVKHNMNGFVRYNERIFSWADQERLAHMLLAAKRRGAIILATNANHRSIRDLYRPHFHLTTVPRVSQLAADTTARGIADELIITSYAV